MIKCKIKLSLLGIFLILATSILLLFLYIKNSSQTKYLQEITNNNVQKYNVIYNDYKKLAKVLYTERVNTNSVKQIFQYASSSDKKTKERVRAELYNELKESYDFFKTLNIKQFHFHLPNNDSFLRFHKPKRYGDNLTGIRATVKYVNDTHKKIDGFEEGRLYSGYRFVYPLFLNDKYLGSVETSFSTVTMSIEFKNYYKNTAIFLASKKNVKNKIFKSEVAAYEASQYKDFVLEKELFNKLDKKDKKIIFTNVSKESKDEVHKRVDLKESFSLYDANTKTIITFIKVINRMTNKAVGILLVYNDAQYILQINKIFIVALILTYAFILLALLFVYKQLKYREELQVKIAEAIEKDRVREKAMLQQSKLAQMGEMISMIAHQWRQPLSAISATSASLHIKAELGTLDAETGIELSDKITNYAQHLSTTIDDFREFFKPKKEKKETTYVEIIQSVLSIIETTVITNNIKIITQFDDKSIFNTHPNEIKQVALNLLKNAEDVLIEKDTKSPYIKVRTYKHNEVYFLEISDNAGGIPEDIIDKIFDPYFSTKTKKDGTGLGLYMSKTIIEEHCSGKLSVSNNEVGAVFTVELVNLTR